MTDERAPDEPPPWREPQLDLIPTTDQDVDTAEDEEPEKVTVYDAGAAAEPDRVEST